MKLESGPIPLYHQMEQHLLTRLREGEFPPGALLPTEEQFCQEYGVSRITVRKALDSLTRQGGIVRRRGVGSFAAELHDGVHSIRLTGSLDEFLHSAVKLRSRVISNVTIMADYEVAKSLNLTEGDPVTRLELVSANGEGPLAHLVIYFPLAVGGMLTDEDVTGDVPVIRMVERKLSTAVVRAEQIILPDVAGEDTAQHFGVEPGTPILRVQRTYFTAPGHAVEAAFIYYHPERYRYAIELRARPQAI
ncbi:MAG: GntR family transcriptional regulator [Sphingorhabdus sp.]